MLITLPRINLCVALGLQKQHLMHFPKAQFGWTASAVIIQEALTNVWFGPVELTSVYFGPAPEIFTANEYGSRGCARLFSQ